MGEGPGIERPDDKLLPDWLGPRVLCYGLGRGASRVELLSLDHKTPNTEVCPLESLLRGLVASDCPDGDNSPLCHLQDDKALSP